MAQSVTLPSGKVANLRPVNDVTERQRRPLVKLRSTLASNAAFVEAVQKHESGKKLTKAEDAALQESLVDVMGTIEQMGDLVIIAAVESWNYPFDVTYDNLLDVAARDLDELRRVAAPYINELMPDFSINKDKNSPTAV